MLAFKHNAGGYVTPGMLASNVETSGGTNITAHRYNGGLLISEKGSDSDLKRPDLWLN
jgi:hypothetical protein